MRIEVVGQPFDPWAALVAYQSASPSLAGKYGATVSFVGTLRDFNEGAAVERMWLEHYPGMTEKYLRRVAETAISRWPVSDALVIHRYGEIALGDPIVLVAVWAGHREPAFAACRYIIDELKTQAPFWKRELSAAGPRWLEPTPDKR